MAGARTDAIAAAAGVNKALLYYYFKSKESLYEAVVEDHFSEFNRQALEVLAAPGPARAVLLRYVSLHFDFISAQPSIRAVVSAVDDDRRQIPGTIDSQIFRAARGRRWVN